MFDWIGSLKLRERSPMRVTLTLSRATQVAGAVVCLFGIFATTRLWPVSPWLGGFAVLTAISGLVLATMTRRLVFDREAGVLRIEQRTAGIPVKTVVPLFHLRAVVVKRQSEVSSAPWQMAGTPTRYVAFVERRVGELIYLDESRRCAKLLKMAEAIAEVAELRLEYDAMSQAAP